MSPKVSVFLPSYNKGAYVLDAMRSVFAQTITDWELWILENSNDNGVTRKLIEQEIVDFHSPAQGEYRNNKIHYIKLDGEEIERRRAESYITAWLMNVYYPEANGEYIFYLSDDDLIDPDCLEIMSRELDEDPAKFVVWAGLRTAGVTGPGQTGPFPNTGIPAKDAKSFPGTANCQVDGGQVMHRKTALDALVWPYFEETNEASVANHADGIFLERLVGRFIFHPIDKYLITHRWTPISQWSRTDI